jgi:VWFA-related protein
MKLGFLMLGAALLAQTPASQQPVFRSTTTVVPLTVTVLDEKGLPVTDLKASEFTVYENKQSREIVNFFPQAFAPGPVQPVLVSTVARGRLDGVVPQTRRTFLIVLGYGRIQWPTNALDGAIDLVRNRLMPQDAVAVMGFHRTTNFTTDHEAVAKILERYKKDHEKIVLDINWFLEMSRAPEIKAAPGSKAGNSAPPGGAPIPDKLLNRIDAIFLGSNPETGPAAAAAPISIRYTAELLLRMTKAFPITLRPGPAVGEPYPQTLAEIQQIAKQDGNDLSDSVLRSTRLKLFGGVEYLRYMDGEKHMVFLANEGPAESADDAAVVAKRANDARVIVDMVATNGTSRRAERSGARTGRDVAELTGGSYTSLDMATKALAKIDQASRFSYLLGYTPLNPNLDGQYRDVEVRVSRPGVTVRYSHGYFAAAEPEPLVLKELIAKSRMELALSYDSQAKDIKLGMNATLLPRIGVQSEVRAEINIDATHLGMELIDGVRTGRLEIVVFCGDAKETVIGDFGERLEIKASEETYAEWLKTGIRRVVRVPMAGVPKFVKVVVYDYGSERAGSFLVTLK